jgi:hypothetical protein
MEDSRRTVGGGGRTVTEEAHYSGVEVVEGGMDKQWLAHGLALMTLVRSQ